MKKLVLMAVAAVAVSASVSFVSCNEAPKAADSIVAEVEEACDTLCDSICAEADSIVEAVADSVVEAVEAE